MKYLILICAVLVSNKVYPQSGWYPLQSGDINHIISIQFIDAQTGYYISTSNVCFKTTNGGDQWNLIATFGTLINDMTFLNAATGYISACDGKVYRTTNSGITWGTFNTGSSSCFSTITFLNSQTGWVSAQSSYTSNTVYKTINGGVNWFLLGIIPGIERTFRIRFTDNQTGWAGGQKNSNYDGIFLRTTNGGANWIVTLDAADEVDDFYFINSQTGWVVSGGRVYRSTNSGGNWSEQLHVAGHFSTCSFVDANTGWAQGLSGSDGMIYKTTNSGLNWSSQSVPGAYNLLTMYFINAQTGWTAGLLGKMYKTTNGGELITGIEPVGEEIPGIYSLSQNYPNPFNPATNIKFSIPKAGFVKLTVYDMLGREIETLVNENLVAGTYKADWNASNFSSGVFFYKIETAGFTDIRKMILVK
ncbi:MAG: T9SS type A sorting domain-containing protein [Ignavibacteria bacterium]